MTANPGHSDSATPAVTTFTRRTFLKTSALADTNGNNASDSSSGGPNKAVNKTTGLYLAESDVSAPGTIVVSGQSTYSQSVAISWKFAYKVKIGSEAQPDEVDKDCASCLVNDVKLALEYNDKPLKLPAQKSYDLPSFDGPSLRRGYKIRNIGSCPVKPKIGLGGQEGEIDIALNNITIEITSTVAAGGSDA